MIEKAKDSDVFGIVVGTLSLKGVDKIIEEVKDTLKKNNKKTYTFLLGKITLEKLSNFVDYIDCFILIACPFSPFYDFKALMKPLVSPLDIKLAFDSSFVWDSTYTFDSSKILGRKEEKEDIKEEFSIPNIDSLQIQYGKNKLVPIKIKLLL